MKHTTWPYLKVFSNKFLLFDKWRSACEATDSLRDLMLERLKNVWYI